MRGWPFRPALPLMLCITSCATRASSEGASDWKMFELGDFSVSLPSDMRSVPVRGIDSHVGEFQGEGLKVDFDYGLYSNPLTRRDLSSSRDLQSFSEDWTLIDGRRAKIVHASWTAKEGAKPDYFCGVYFPDVSLEDPNSKGRSITKLNLCISSERPIDPALADHAFRSIRFGTR